MQTGQPERAGTGKSRGLYPRRDLEQAMVVRALRGAVDLPGPGMQRPVRGRVFERAFEPRGEHRADLAAEASALLVYESRVAEAHGRGAGPEIDVQHLELPPAALGDAPHVVVEGPEAVQPVMSGFLLAPMIGRAMASRPQYLRQPFGTQLHLECEVVV